MAKGAGFFKGEKKKTKKDKDKAIAGIMSDSSAPTYVMPEVISKKKKNNEW